MPCFGLKDGQNGGLKQGNVHNFGRKSKSAQENPREIKAPYVQSDAILWMSPIAVKHADRIRISHDFHFILYYLLTTDSDCFCYLVPSSRFSVDRIVYFFIFSFIPPMGLFDRMCNVTHGHFINKSTEVETTFTLTDKAKILWVHMLPILFLSILPPWQKSDWPFHMCVCVY